MIYNIDIEVVKSGAKCSENTLEPQKIRRLHIIYTQAREEKHPKKDERRCKVCCQANTNTV